MVVNSLTGEASSRRTLFAAGLVGLGSTLTFFH